LKAIVQLRVNDTLKQDSQKPP